jgi:hypothetical protein
VPARLVEGMERISLASDSERAHYEEYREAWHLLQPAKRKSSMIDRIEACAEDFGCRMGEPVSAVPRFGGMVGRLLWRESAGMLGIGAFLSG